MPTFTILVFEQLPCFPDKLVPVLLQTSGLGVGCLFVGLGVRCHVSPFHFPRLWSPCLNAHFVPHQHEPFDEHCFAISSFLDTWFVTGGDWDDSVFHPALCVFKKFERMLLLVCQNICNRSLQLRAAPPLCSEPDRNDVVLKHFLMRVDFCNCGR